MDFRRQDLLGDWFDFGVSERAINNVISETPMIKLDAVTRAQAVVNAIKLAKSSCESRLSSNVR